MNFNLNNNKITNEITEKKTSPTQHARELLVLHEAGAGVNYPFTNEVALGCVEEVLENWLPDGVHRGRQYVAYNPPRTDGSLGSFTINKNTGVWKDFSSDDGGSDLIGLIAFAEGGISQKAAALKLLQFIAGFDPIRTSAIAERTSKANTTPKSLITPIFPVPESARKPPCFFGERLGKPTMTWEYKNEHGELLCLVNRFEPESGKTYLPLTWCRDEAGFERWYSKAPISNKPLYGLDRLAAKKEAIVLITEGEKAADAAQRLFPDFVTTTTMGGAQAPERADLTPLVGRKIYIARDNDKAGLAYQDKLAELLTQVGATVLAFMNIEALAENNASLPNGYDLADAEADGWTDETIDKLGQSLWCQREQKHPGVLPAPIPQDKSAKKRAQRDPNKVPDLEFVKGFMSNYSDKIMTIDGRVLAYENGYWRPLAPDLEIKRLLLEDIGETASARRINCIYELMKIRTAESSSKMERTSALICLNNGTLNPLNKTLLEHSPENYLTNKLEIEYRSDANCPLWVRTLEEIFGCDEDCAEKIGLVQEFMGYCLIPDTRHTKFLWMVGAGGNGKSVILSIFAALVGRPNISFAQIERLERPAVRAELQGKLLNISSEMSADATLSDSYLKQIVAGEVIEAERKFEPSFSFKSTARLIAATNTLPRLLDHSDGFARRAMILRFNRQFTENERDINREKNLMEELPGILNWALEGLSRLETRGKFVAPTSSTEELAQYRLDSDPIKLFADEYLTPTEDKTVWVKSGELYESYKNWTGTNGFTTLSIQVFGRRLENIGIHKYRNKQARRWMVKYEVKYV